MIPAPHLPSLVLVTLLALAAATPRPVRAPGPDSAHIGQEPADAPAGDGCFLLHEIGVGMGDTALPETCRTRLTPASTFKIPHALAALDSGVIDGPETSLTYDGSSQPFERWRRDHTLRTAMHDSVVWYFQRVAERLGDARERDYLRRFAFGNGDTSSGLTSFWLGGSLLVSPEEQLRFLLALYADDLPVSRRAMGTVREILVQPRGQVVNAMGAHPFGRWPADLTLSAKTGSARGRDGRDVRWLVGHARRGPRAWIFVSAVVGRPTAAAMAAIELAAGRLAEHGVLER